MNKNKVVVKIFGDEYPISGVADPTYISKIADFVDSKMRETATASNVKVKDRVAILAAMSIASELHEKNEKLETLNNRFESRLDNINNRLDNILADF
ncbi:MAG: cell division protein ZapA [candidate division Zixibacteria bacterium]|nr:cell division protein ZapA [candidate division Zixibacteria bacterium]RKX19029.1 MAG: cell division protein ZapA [candidate division Zixibacteria bacterium]